MRNVILTIGKNLFLSKLSSHVYFYYNLIDCQNSIKLFHKEFCNDDKYNHCYRYNIIL